jgi:hypothetical protein
MSAENDKLYDSRFNNEPPQDEQSDPHEPDQYFLEEIAEPEDGIPTT